MTSTGRPARSHSTARPRSCIQRYSPDGGLEAVFEFHRVAQALRVFAQLAVDALAILGMQVAEPGIRRRVPLRARIAGHRQPQRAGGARIAGHVPLPECGARAPQRGGEPRLAVAARDFLALAPVDVEQQAGDARRGAVALTLHDAATVQHPQPAMTGGQQPVFALEAVTAVLAGIAGRVECAEVVGMNASLPFAHRHRPVGTSMPKARIQASSTWKRSTDSCQSQTAACASCSAERNSAGSCASGAACADVGTGIHDRLLLPVRCP